MKLQISQENLNQGLSIASRFVSSRPQLPILSSILLSVDNGKLRLSATNLELGINIWLGAKIEKEGSLAMPAKEMAEFVSYLSTQNVDLVSEKDNQLTISSSQATASFVGMRADEFPQIPKLDKQSSFSLPLKGLSEAVSQVGFAAASDETRPVLEGIFWQFGNGEYSMVATDGYRLSLKKVVLEQKSGEEKSAFLVPAKTLSEVIRLGKQETVQIGLTKGQNQAIFAFPQMEISSRLLEGEFPEYEKIIPQSTKTKVFLNKDDFAQSVKIASVFARESANIVLLNIDKQEITITANAPQVGENKTSLPVKAEGEPVKIAFNFKFLLDFVNAVPADKKDIIIELNDSLSPTVFKIDGDDTWLHIIMPVRMEE